MVSALLEIINESETSSEGAVSKITISYSFFNSSIKSLNLCEDSNRVGLGGISPANNISNSQSFYFCRYNNSLHSDAL